MQYRGGEEPEVRHCARDVHARGERQRLARVHGLRARESSEVLFDPVRDGEQQAGARSGGSGRPAGEGGLRRTDGPLDVLRVATGHPAVDLADGRVDVVEPAPACGLDQLAVDVVEDPVHVRWSAPSVRQASSSDILRWITRSGWTSPWSMPGQKQRSRFQALREDRLLPQKGKVRHCVGRTS